MTKFDVLNYRQEQVKLRIKKHQAILEIDGPCGGLTVSEYKKIKTPLKKAGMKGKRPAYNRIWSHHNLSKREMLVAEGY